MQGIEPPEAEQEEMALNRAFLRKNKLSSEPPAPAAKRFRLTPGQGSGSKVIVLEDDQPQLLPPPPPETERSVPPPPEAEQPTPPAPPAPPAPSAPELTPLTAAAARGHDPSGELSIFDSPSRALQKARSIMSGSDTRRLTAVASNILGREICQDLLKVRVSGFWKSLLIWPLY